MADDFLAAMMGNPSRARMLRVFALSPNESFALPRIAKRAGVSPTIAERELRVLEQWGVIKKGRFQIKIARIGRTITGNQKEKTWILSQSFKHTPAVSKFIHEITPVHSKTILASLRKTGRLAAVILSGSFMGDQTRPADLLIAGNGVNEELLEQAVRALEPQLGREIRYAVFTLPEFRYRLTIQDRLLRDTLDYPHVVLLDRSRLL